MGFSYISEQGQRVLPDYEYKGTDRSIFYKYVSSPGCNVIVEYIPNWVAPNLITFLGLMVMVFGHVVILRHSPDLTGDLPSWVCYLQAVVGLTYQTMDNLDGKQARRTGTSSPLGLIFDHGIDALVVTVGGLSLSAIFQVSNNENKGTLSSVGTRITRAHPLTRARLTVSVCCVRPFSPP